MDETIAPEVFRLCDALTLLDQAGARLDPVARVRAAEAVLVACGGIPVTDRVGLVEQVLAGEEYLHWAAATDI